MGGSRHGTGKSGDGGRGGDGRAHRTPAGDVLLPARPRRTAPPHAGARRAHRMAVPLRVAAVVLAVLAVAAALITGVALASGPLGTTAGAPAIGRPVTPSPGTGSPATPPPGGTGSVRPYPPAPSSPGGAPSTSEPPPSPGPGGITAARARVSGFVAALNAGDFQRADTFLCAAMAGSYGASSLDGIVPGSLAVGGVAVQQDSGTAIVTFRLTGGTQPGRTVFGLVVEHETWMVCQPQ